MPANYRWGRDARGWGGKKHKKMDNNWTVFLVELTTSHSQRSPQLRGLDCLLTKLLTVVVWMIDVIPTWIVDQELRHSLETDCGRGFCQNCRPCPLLDLVWTWWLNLIHLHSSSWPSLNLVAELDPPPLTRQRGQLLGLTLSQKLCQLPFFSVHFLSVH